MAGDINFGGPNSALQLGNNYGTINIATSPEESARRIEIRREKALASLEFKEMDSRRLNIEKSLKETCEWLLSHEDYKTWLDDEQIHQHHGFFWISGKPGAGKSTIMKFAYLDMKSRCQDEYENGHRDNPVIASFFFNARGEELEKSVQGLYRSLLVQILEEFPDLQVVLDDEDLVPRRAQNEAISCPPVNALKELLHNAIVLLGERALTCFIDALDECNENDIADMIDYFEDLTEKALGQNSSFRICFSSRHYPHITLNYGIRLTLESQPGHSRDLELYVSTRLKIKNADLRQKLQSRLLDKAAGVFLWVVLVVGILNKEYRRAGFNLERRLEELPSDLSHLFKDILLRDTGNTEDLLFCVLWILYTKRPLTPEEFYHALWSSLAMKQQNLADEGLPELIYSSSNSETDSTSHSSSSLSSISNSFLDFTVEWKLTRNLNTFKFKEPKLKLEELDRVTIYVISSSKGLAEVTNGSHAGRIVQFIHESVRDFLVKDNGLSVLWPGLHLSDEAIAHEMLKQCCSFYMNHGLRKMWPDKRDPTLNLNSGFDHWLKSKAKELREYAFLDYATQYVLFHAEHAAKSTPQDDFLSSFPLFEWKKTMAFYIRLYHYRDRDSLNYWRDPGARRDENYGIIMRRSAHVGSNIRYWERTGTLWAENTGNSNKKISTIGRNDGLFHIFAMYGFSELIRTRRRRDTNVHALGGNIKHPIFAALRNGHIDAFAALLDLPNHKGKDLLRCKDSGSDPLPSLAISEFQSGTPICWAARNGLFEVVELLLLDKVVPVQRGQSALVEAIKNGHKDIARLLVEKGADVNYLYPLAEASEKGYEDLVEILIDSGADVNKGGPLTGASAGGYEAIVKLLLSKGADANPQIEGGFTPLYFASRRGHSAVVKLLIDYGANVDHEGNVGSTPLRTTNLNLNSTMENMMTENTTTKTGNSRVARWVRGYKEIFH